MKKFQFSLETVLDYKQNALDALQVEYGLILAKIRLQEEALSAAQARYAQTNEEFREKKRTGVTIAGMRTYEIGLQVFEQNINHEMEKLTLLRQQEAQLHARLLESKIDTASLELLREKKLNSYQKEVQKQEERMIDELFSTARVDTLVATP